MTEAPFDPLITILGPTASGKTSLAVSLAEEIGAEIISADSRQVYKGMDIGTGKDLSAYKDIPYHLIDIRDAGAQYNVAAFQNDFHKAFTTIQNKKKPAILCGGTGLYIQAVLQDFKNITIPKNEDLRSVLEKLDLKALLDRFESIKDPSFHQGDPSTKKQIIRAIEVLTWQQNQNVRPQENQPIPHLIFGLDPTPENRRKQISMRLQERLDQGLLSEVETLLSLGISSERLIKYGLEYKWATLYLIDALPYSEFYSQLEIAIHQYAKRQMTYFRKMQKDGLTIHWLKEEFDLDQQLDFIKRKLESFNK